MADEPKQKMISEEDHKRRLTAELEKMRDRHLSWNVSNRVGGPQDAAPRISISLEGGNEKMVRMLAIKIERMIVDFAEQELREDK